MEKYNQLLQLVQNKLGNDVTNADQLEKLCKYYFGHLFSGVFPYDISHFKPQSKYMIINLDPLGKPGIHWLGVAKISNGKYMVYDTFGRRTTSILSHWKLKNKTV